MLSPGYKTGRWTLVDIAFKRRGESVWNVVCDCGNTKQVPAGNLKSGKSGSCGCLNAEVLSARSKTHGLRSRPVYAVWNSMRQRCQNPNSKQWPDYGGRGITVCDTWNTFENFYADMGEPPSPEGCLDRVDNDKDYSKENCRWTTRAINNLNRRNTVMVLFGEDSMPLIDVAAKAGVTYGKLYQRMFTYGYGPEKMLSGTPLEGTPVTLIRSNSAESS